MTRRSWTFEMENFMRYENIRIVASVLLRTPLVIFLDNGKKNVNTMFLMAVHFETLFQHDADLHHQGQQWNGFSRNTRPAPEPGRRYVFSCYRLDPERECLVRSFGRRFIGNSADNWHLIKRLYFSLTGITEFPFPKLAFVPEKLSKKNILSTSKHSAIITLVA